MAITASLLLSFISVIGIFFLNTRKKNLKRDVLALVGVAVGALLGDAFLHLIPESTEIIGFYKSGLMTIFGFLLFFILEKILKWRHCHNVDCHEGEHLAGMSLAADSIHNLIDGLIIGGSFMVSPSIGLTTSLAVMLHEIPQEIGDLAILMHSGLGLRKAVIMNLISAFFSVVGVLCVWVLGNRISVSGELMGMAAGGFIYLAASDLIPELHRHQSKIGESVWQLITVSFGVGIMIFLV